MFNMTPELQAQLTAWFIGAVGTSGAIIAAIAWLLVRRFKNKIDQDSKDREAERDAKLLELKSSFDNQKQSNELRFLELKDDAHTKDELFKLNQAHANSYDIVANAIKQLTGKTSEFGSQVEVFGQQLQQVSTSNTYVVSSVDKLAIRLNEHIENANETLSDIQQEIADALDTTSSAQDQRLQKIFAEFSEIRRILQQIKRRNDETKPLPELEANGDLVQASNASDSDNANKTDNEEKKDIV